MIWTGLKTFLVVSTWGGGCYHQWVEARDAAKRPTVHKTVPQQRHVHHKLSKVPRLINFGLMEVLETSKTPTAQQVNAVLGSVGTVKSRGYLGVGDQGRIPRKETPPPVGLERCLHSRRVWRRAGQETKNQRQIRRCSGA